MLGKPVIKGTRITVEIILRKLAEDISVDEILADYPGLDRQDVLAALAYAARLPGQFTMVSEAKVRIRPPR